MSAILLGAIAAFPSYFALLYRARTRLDDSLDVSSRRTASAASSARCSPASCAQKSWNGGTGDGVIAGNWHQLGVQVIAILATIIYSTVVTLIIVKALAALTSLRAAPREEGLGLDFTQHGEEAYSRGEGAILLLDGRTE